ncbi:AcrR family transcriptional regulator [Caulobacter ginsengisoli]|uniref:AcrR family transcriptional regulator n=1 Tax=Caulobacter ginsengisoli TaxID=400775 RepID=A0ABU0IZS4_9CAUL|nr:TetR/AcrR family transcriptional regulator [Caulobacter ginsengisoli]MDQ0466529.1 AcrR family transcriptional regulator [Caulobacter ginsengisoli]
MTPGQPKWRRRKEARPSEIVEAALEVFAEKGFAAARLDDIAAQAGVSKGALYLYFETKQDLFRAVVRQAISPNLDQVEAAVAAADIPFGLLLRGFYGRMLIMLTTTRIGAVAKMVIGESRNFPDLAQVWHDELVSRAVTLMSGVIARAQARGEVRPGDPRLHAFSIVGPILLGVLWTEVFTPVGAQPIDLAQLVNQHADTILAGLLVQPEAQS